VDIGCQLNEECDALVFFNGITRGGTDAIVHAGTDDGEGVRVNSVLRQDLLSGEGEREGFFTTRTEEGGQNISYIAVPSGLDETWNAAAGVERKWEIFPFADDAV
jgi:hypothetical protein